MNAMRKRINAARGNDDGFTLIELLVVIIIIGILASVAIPRFLGQREKGFDASVKADLKNAASAAETYFTDALTYPTTSAGFSSQNVGTATGAPPKSDNTEYVAFVNATGANAGYVIYGRHTSSTNYYVVSSWNNGKPVKLVGSALPTAAPVAGDTNAAIPTGTPALSTAITW